MLRRYDHTKVGSYFQLSGVFIPGAWERERRKKNHTIRNKKKHKRSHIRNHDMRIYTQNSNGADSMPQPCVTGCTRCRLIPAYEKRIKQKLGSVLQPGPEVIKLFSCSSQLSMKIFPLINVKMPTTVGILTFMSEK